MNDEIKEIKHKLQLLHAECNSKAREEDINWVIDYITNLQQEIVRLKEDYVFLQNASDEYEDEEEQKHLMQSYYDLHEKYYKLQQENERLKELDESYPIEEELAEAYKREECYKSRCEKAIEYMKQHEKDGTLWLVKSTDDLLNILQNGSDSQ